MTSIYKKLLLVLVIYLACCDICSAGNRNKCNSCECNNCGCNNCGCCNEHHDECNFFDDERVTFNRAFAVYEGCYPDVPAGSEFANLLASSPLMTVEACYSLALARGFTYFGVEDGTFCYGGFFYGKSAANASACTSSCGGDSNSVCGGPTANSIYQVLPNAAETRPLFVGCFTDNTARDMTYVLNSPTMSVEICNQLALANHFPFFGVQYGTQCFAGNSYGRYGPGICNEPCSANPSEICGNAYANSVYLAGTNSK